MKTAVIICPGRGTYNKAELGYLQRHFPDANLLNSFDTIRQEAQQASLSELDGAQRYSVAVHTRGDNASALIYAATLGDFMAINRKHIDVVAVTGNSMGWYSALACAGALSASDGFLLSNTMGTLMQEALIGGQIIYPFVDEQWQAIPDKREEIISTIADINNRKDHALYLSINLGGMLVLAGNDTGLKAFENAMEPALGKFPMRLNNHAAFHTVLQNPVAHQGQEIIDPKMFNQPQLPLIDGRGSIWWPKTCETDALYDYTLGEQVTQTYDFTRAITIAAREFAPDYFIITGPGTTLGGAVAQSLIFSSWHNMQNKSDFQNLQEVHPLLISMGMEQREIVV